MNAEHSPRRPAWLRFAVYVAMVLAATLVASLGYPAWEYTAWRNKMIEWDYGTIDRLCGGDTEQERLLEIRFVKPWEYKALKRTPDGTHVWLHWKLSKRHCGNWMLIDAPDGFVLQPFEVRFPKGAPPRGAVSCLGISVDENEKYKRRDEILARLRGQ